MAVAGAVGGIVGAVVGAVAVGLVFVLTEEDRLEQARAEGRDEQRFLAQQLDQLARRYDGPEL